jgi:hypothetical protein
MSAKYAFTLRLGGVVGPEPAERGLAGGPATNTGGYPGREWPATNVARSPTVLIWSASISSTSMRIIS